MTHVVADFVKEQTATTGTGTTIALGGTVDAHQAFSSVMADGDTCDFYIEDLNGRAAGKASYVSATNELTLDVIRSSTFAGGGVNLSGNAKIGIDLPGNKKAARDAIEAMPVGGMIWWPTNTPPTGFLERDGSAISRTTYADLFAVIGTDYGTGDGSTTFNLPDDRGEFIRGWDHGRGVDSGRAIGSTQLDQMQRIYGYLLSSPVIRRSGTTAQHGAVQGRTGPNDAPDGGTSASFDGFYVDSLDSPNARVSPGTGGETRARNRAYMPLIKY